MPKTKRSRKYLALPFFAIFFRVSTKFFTLFFFNFQGQTFSLPEETLNGFAFSIVVYVSVGFLCIVLLVCRRFFSLFGNCELGGAVTPKYVSGAILVGLWFLYVGLIIMKTSTGLLDGFL